MADPDEHRTRAELLAELAALRAQVAASAAATSALREREALLEVVLRGVTDAITMLAPDGRTVYANAAAAALIGVPDVETLLSSPYAQLISNFELLDHDGGPLPSERLPTRRAFQGERVVEAPLRFRVRGDDRDRWSLLTSTPIFDETGAVRHVVNIFRDISERIDAERARQHVRDELRLRALVLESMAEGVSVADERGIIVYTNAAEDAMFGYAPGELLGQHVSVQNNYPPAENHRIVAAVRDHLAAHGVWVGELDNIKKDGTPFVTHARISALDLSDRRHLLCVQEDITQEKRDREALLFLSEASTMLVGSLDHTRTLQDLTRLAVPRLGSWCSVYLQEDGGPIELAAVNHVEPERAALLRELHARFPPDPHEPDGLAAVLRTGTSLLASEIDDAMLQRAARSPDELALLRQLGPHSCVITPLIAQGRTFGAISIAIAGASRRYDAFDLVLVEELARRAAVAVDNARLFVMGQKERARAEEANRAKDLFLSTLSHELRTPLTAILGWTRMLRTGGLPPEKREKGLETIDRNARAQVALIEDILDLSRIVTGKLRLELQPVELTTIIEAAIETVRPALDARSLRLQLALDPDVAAVIGDPNRLQQIVWNLLTNAVKFTPRGGSIQVGLRRAAAHVEISVVDDGQGIDPALLPYVFDRFRQSDASTTRSLGGLGLGLAIVKHLLELHGGTIHAASDGEGRGATFLVKIPVAPLPAPTVPAALATVRREARELVYPPEIAGLRVLVVDDEHDVRDWVGALLEHCGAVVSSASSAAQALEALRAHLPDVLVSDIGMPGEDGYTLISRVRALAPAEGGQTPAIALTAYARAEDRARALAAGFDMHVAKPIEPTELLISIVDLSRRRPRA